MPEQSSYLIFTVLDNVATVDHRFQGTGNPRVFESQGGIFVYGMGGSLLFTPNGWLDVDDIMPDQHTVVTAMAESTGSDVWGGFDVAEFSSIAVAFGRESDKTASAVYQKTVDMTYHAWREAGDLPTNFSPSDAIGDDPKILGILVGSWRETITERIMKDVTQPPYGNWAESDTGIPSANGVTDLEGLFY